jgi:hypothetical protein
MMPPDPSPATTRAVVRSRLLGRMGDARLVVLTAPSGYGKATLARQLAEHRGAGAVTCRLVDADAADAGTTRLLGGLVRAFPHLGGQPPVVDRTGAARLAYALADLAGPVTLVVEGLHLLDDGGETLVATVLGAADPTVTLVVTTEADPSAEVARRAARGDALVLGAADMLFDRGECDELAALMGSDRSGSELAARSGGWPLVAAAVARSGSSVDDVLAGDALGELDHGAQDALATVGLLSSVPRAALDPVVAVELERFARRHPALLDVDEGRWSVRDPLRSHLGRAAARTGGAPDAVADMADRLERIGCEDDALILLSRAAGGRDLLQQRLDARGPSLLDAGRYTLIRRLVTEIPSAARTGEVKVLDAAAALGLDQIAPGDRPGFRVDDSDLSRLAGDDRLGDDLRLAVAGLRTEFLRRRGDGRLVEVALAALGGVGPVDGSVPPAELVAGRHPLARRGLVQVLHGLGSAAQFSGDAAMIAEGGRLIALAFGVAETSDLDVVPLRAQAAYERTLIGLAWPVEALAPLEAGVASLESIGHPEAANLLAELADTHLRCADAASAITVAEAAEDWARRTGNALALPSAALVRAGAELLRDGPSEVNDRALDAAWHEVVAHPRLRRALPSLAVRVANAQLDHRDTTRAARWLDRARARIGDLVQGPYQQQFLTSVEERMSLQLGGGPTPLAGDDRLFEAQPTGRLERWATLAWDALRDGREEPARHLLATCGALPRPWSERLDPGAPAAAAGPDLLVRLLCPEIRVERDGHTLATPSGHAGRLLAQLVIADGALTVDAVVEDLWPDADPAAARNRLHQVLHRLRRTLDVGADGPVALTDGVVRLDRTSVTSDVSALRSLDLSDRSAVLDAVRGYESDLCSAQFAYDAAFDDARWELSSRLHDAVAALVAGDGARDAEATAAVWDVWVRLSDEDRVGLTLAAALDRSGDTARAAEIRSRITDRPDPTWPD